MGPFVAIILFYVLTAIVQKGVRNAGTKSQTTPFDRIRGPRQQTGDGRQAGSPRQNAGSPGQTANAAGNQTSGSGQQTLSGSPNRQTQSPFKRQMGAPVHRQGQYAENADAGQRDVRSQLLGRMQQAMGKVSMGQPVAKKQQSAARPQSATPNVQSMERQPAAAPGDHSSATLSGRRPPMLEGPTHDETIDHIYKLDDCESPAEEFLVQKKKGGLSVAEGMIWTQILGQPRGRQPMLKGARLQRKESQAAK